MTNKFFWNGVIVSTLISIIVGTVVALNYHWLYGLIAYFAVDLILDAILIHWAIKQGIK